MFRKIFEATSRAFKNPDEIISNYSEIFLAERALYARVIQEMKYQEKKKNLKRPIVDVCPCCLSTDISHAFTIPYFKVHRFKWATSESSYRKMVKPEHQGAVFDVSACGKCRALFVPDSHRDLVEYVESHPLYREETIRNWFDLSHFPVTDEVCRRIAANEELSPVEAKYRRHLDRLLPVLRETGRFMDIGANVGTFAALLASQAPRASVHACETNPAFLAKGRSRYPHLNWTGSPLTTQPALEPFDLLHVCDVIEHIWDLDAFVAALRAHLRPDGHLMVVTPDGDHASAKRDGTDWWAYIVPHHCQILTLLSLDRLMARHGLLRIDHATDGEEFWALYQPVPDTAP